MELFTLLIKGKGGITFRQTFYSLSKADKAFISLARSGVPVALLEGSNVLEQQGFLPLIEEHDGEIVIPAKWKVDEKCATKRLVDTCLECVRFEKGQCQIALDEYAKIAKGEKL